MHKQHLLLITTISLFVTSCLSSPTAIPIVQTNTPVPTSTLVPTPTESQLPTPTFTLSPQPTPTMTATPQPPTLSQLAKPLGIRLGTTVNAGDPWRNSLYWTRVSEFGIAAPIGYTVEDVFYRLTPQGAGQFGEQFKTTINERKLAFRIYNLFWHADYRDKPSDPLWKGAPPKGQPPSSEYKEMVGKAMDDKITVVWRKSDRT